MNTSAWILFYLASLVASSTQPNGKNIANGTYTGKSCANYSYEPYVGITTLKIENQKIVDVSFQIVDTLKNEIFGSDYEKHFPDNEEYRKQSRNDWQGVLNYPKQLLEKQDISKVDGVSGATWSYNLFKASVEKALKK